MFTPQFLATAASGRWTSEPSANAPVSGFSVDTRHIQAGQCFVALRTARRDGHAFLADALAAGATAAIVVVADAAVDLPQLVVADPLAAFQSIAKAHRATFTGPVIGVTGSAGKTSTKELLALLLSASPGDVLATAGNLNNHLGVPLTLTRLDSAQHKLAVIEAGISAPSDMETLATMIRPDHAVVTLIGPAHLAALGTLENVAREKAVLPAAVPPGGLRILSVGCVNYDAFRLLPEPGIVVVPQITHTAEQTHLVISVQLGSEAPVDHRFVCRRLSDGMARNAGLALSLALRLGVSAADAQHRIAKWQPAALRGEHVHDHAGRWLYVDCYNANPASMLDALEAFVGMAPVDEPRLFLISGMEELGTDSIAYHQRLGQSLDQILRPQDSAYILADAEVARAVVEGARRRTVFAADNLAALRTRCNAHKGAVFIKGSRRYQLESLLLPNVAVLETQGTAL
ncbi:MAG: UDP-N-acetylmuramoyl-tripeptide--D-alanyl-D-alanine ligase [Verrucomicrobia bacterium]|nr:MAG: UDP-N-acetylmuramoyl-tripeptide--D-alanyl-D-alanine ligase [Verrucomicrobiota bacterium]